MAAITEYTLDAATNSFIEAATGKQVTVEIGDTKDSSVFQPQIKLMPWDNECNVSFRLDVAETEKADAVVTTNGDVIKWQTDAIEAHFYAKEADAINENGAYEFEIVLNEAPASNVIDLTLNVPKDLDFFYQGELTQAEIDEGCIRPENVVGSYAAYHASKRDNGYKTGKAFHIYRPFAIDAKGQTTWCDLKIEVEAQIAHIVIPIDWLKAAVYPVIIDPTFGYTSVGGSNSLSSGYNNIFQSCGDGFTLASAAEGVSMSMYTKKGSGDASLQLGLYIGSNLVSNGYTPSITVNSTTAQWWTGNFTTAPNLSAATYFPCYNFNADLYYYYDETASNERSYCAQSFGTWPATVSWTSNGQYRILSAYCTYKVTEAVSAVCASVSTAIVTSKVARKVGETLGSVSSVASSARRSSRISCTVSSIGEILGMGRAARRIVTSIDSMSSLLGGLTSSGAAYVYMAAINDAVSTVAGFVHRTMYFTGTNITSASWLAGWLHKADDVMQAFYTFKDTLIKRAFAISRTLRFYDD